jgi:hypothetical protein
VGNFHKVAQGRFADIIYGTWMLQEAQRKLMPYLPWAASFHRHVERNARLRHRGDSFPLAMRASQGSRPSVYSNHAWDLFGVSAGRRKVGLKSGLGMRQIKQARRRFEVQGTAPRRAMGGIVGRRAGPCRSPT